MLVENWILAGLIEETAAGFALYNSRPAVTVEKHDSAHLLDMIVSNQTARDDFAMPIFPKRCASAHDALP